MRSRRRGRGWGNRGKRKTGRRERERALSPPPSLPLFFPIAPTPPSGCACYAGYAHTYPGIFESTTFSFRIQKFPRPHVIAFVVNLLFSILESGLKIIQIRRMRVDRRRIRKEKVAD